MYSPILLTSLHYFSHTITISVDVKEREMSNSKQPQVKNKKEPEDDSMRVETCRIT
jgi:hypothetical protein